MDNYIQKLNNRIRLAKHVKENIDYTNNISESKLRRICFTISGKKLMRGPQYNQNNIDLDPVYSKLWKVHNNLAEIFSYNPKDTINMSRFIRELTKKMENRDMGEEEYISLLNTSQEDLEGNIFSRTGMFSFT